MSILDQTRFVERLQFFDGQRLFASDLQGIEAFHREMRWLHNRSLHQPGIGRGFAVTGNRDDREVGIGPGYAIDALGREIVLTHDWIEPVPPVSGEPDGKPTLFDLTVSYPDDAGLEVAETREGICLPRGAVRLREQPVFCWARLRETEKGNYQPFDTLLGLQIQARMRIVLTRIEVLDCKLRQQISLAQRRDARPSCQPYIACGEAAIVAWKQRIEASRPSSDFGPITVSYFLAADVDTAAAGFATTPNYSVRFQGERLRVEH
ncbi:MAG TPA: hypothetical protein VEG34_19105, partial [Thermoanaerobaculia bacterium]|nr:hypothetical protein [Thermoanaerobaculia bacterium]